MIEKDLFGMTQTNAIIGKGQDVSVPLITPFLSNIVMPIYDNFNQLEFDKEIVVPRSFVPLCEIVYQVFNQKPPRLKMVDVDVMEAPKSSNDILLAFSGGLDSCFQAIALKEMGYNVHLFHVKNVNAYEGGIQINAVESFANKLNVELIYATWKRKGKKETNKYYQKWGDNAIKNQFIEAIMIDICFARGWNKISLGDDESISVYDSDAKCGINITDCKEIQRGFLDAIKPICKGIEYVGINRGEKSTKKNKYSRIEKLGEYDCVNDYYSCVGAGRFNAYNHKTCEEKFGVTLHRYNCGHYCTKCALHNLLLRYVGNADFGDEFVNKCWERLWNTQYGSYDGLFGRNIPLETRIKNLLTY